MRWLRRLRGALGTGFTWAFGWALTGIGIGVTSLFTSFLPWDVFFRYFDAPLPALAVPGFFGGVLYSMIVSIAGRQRRFEELTMARVARWGALGGFLLACVPSVMMAVGLASGNPENLPPLPLPIVLGPPFALLGAASAAAALWIARRARSQSALGTSADALRLPDESPDAFAQRTAAPSATSVNANHTRD
jgi:hypothetical protein